MKGPISKNKGLQGKDILIANKITRSAQSLSLIEKRLVFAAVAKMGNNFGEIILRADEYAETFEIPVKQAYEQMRDAAHNLRTRYFSLAVPDREGNMKWEINWVEKIGYEEGTGRVGIMFTQSVAPYLCNLKKEFTKYRLRQACSLRSVHAWRLLELFEQVIGDRNEGWLHITVEDFHYAMETTQLQRDNFGKLRTQVISPAIWELVNKENWAIGFEFEKLGRKVHMLKFSITKNPQPNLFSNI